MPNNCENDLRVNGPSEAVEELLKFIGADQDPPQFDFNALIPYLAVFADKDRECRDLGFKEFRDKYGPDAKDGFNGGGYEWCLNNWGTKWNAYQVVRPSHGPKLSFQTAWSPPLPVIVALAAKFPKLEISLEYFECGAAVCGGINFNRREGEESEPSEWKCNDYRGERGG